MSDTLLLVLLLFTKHFIVDFPLQNSYQYLNKGTYGHPGGLLHSSLHGLSTMLVVWFFAPLASVLMGVIDAVVHYHIDWAKMKLNSKFNWKPESSNKFWYLLGFDQYLHALTYILMIGILI